MAHPAPTRCPVCEGELHVTRLVCGRCETSIEGSFSLGRFARLSREQLGFLEAFVQCRGKIKDVEEALGVSYPTVIARLDELVTALGFESAPQEHAHKHEEKHAILREVSEGKLTAREAAARLRSMGKK